MNANERRNRFLNLALDCRYYEDDQGGRQPERRAEMVAALCRIFHRQASRAEAMATLEYILVGEREASRAILTFEDVLAAGLLAARQPAEPDSVLGAVASAYEIMWTRMMQSGPMRKEMHLDSDDQNALFPLAETGVTAP